MRKNWKKLVSLVLTAACTMVVTVAPVFADAASTPAYSPVEASTVDSLLSSSVQWVGQSLMTYSDDDLANMEASDQQFYARAAEAWEEAKADLGEVKSLEDGTLEVDGDFDAGLCGGKQQEQEEEKSTGSTCTGSTEGCRSTGC